MDAHPGLFNDNASLHAYIIGDDEGAFSYDAIGNLVADHEKGVQIEWAPYGKVRNVTAANGNTLAFRYDAAGNRVEKKSTVSGGSVIIITRYVRDASGNVMSEYLGGTTPHQQPIYGSSRLGLYKGQRTEGVRTLGAKQYELTNHLGNVLTVVKDNIHLQGTNSWAGVEFAMDYYAFGGEMPGRKNTTKHYRYGFNGKEKDPESQWGDTSYDYGFRIYNPRYARFLSVDPLTKSYPMLTPYQFASNRPIDGIDLDGLEFFKKGTFYDFEINPTYLTEKDILYNIQLTTDYYSVQNSGLVKLIERNKQSLGFNNTRQGIGAINNLTNDSRGELYSSGVGVGKALVIIGRFSAVFSMADRIASDMEAINQEALILNASKLKNKFESDKNKAEWFMDFINVFAKSNESAQMNFESVEELTQFINFAFDEKLPRSNRVIGFDFEKIEKFKTYFKLMENFYEADQRDNIITVDTGQNKKVFDSRVTKRKPDEN